MTLAPEADSDRYWNTRPVEARVAAAASAQSRPIPSRAAFLSRIEEVTRAAAAGIPRPPRWGAVTGSGRSGCELWVGAAAAAPTTEPSGSARSRPPRMASEGSRWSATRSCHEWGPHPMLTEIVARAPGLVMVRR